MKPTNRRLPKAMRVVLGRERMYDDGSGPRTAVSYDSHYRLGKTPDRFVKIEGVGGNIHVFMQDVLFVIEQLDAILELDEEAHKETI